ncbi:hypothetical protein ATO12_04255 [Aquimarina atlantica]|uniref:HTH marR-type domain-containing protein n=1 Tax=Aquimarina atlantica TaxID=1317122 RepID=A0A023C269_9FLAO|nr:MarR family transcriptional regulator [Aquimarina atlantica]EZH76008.1 hypothetical protein ATO12_04255 [Aquimarina atlantica]
MKVNTPTTTALYSIEQAIKAYRRLCNKNISKIIEDITVDQALILIILNDNSSLTQMQIGDLVFKDYASITRILNLMEKKGYINKGINNKDKRRSLLEITTKGKETLTILSPTIQLNRNTALKNITEDELNQLYTILNKITNNCNQ